MSLRHCAECGHRASESARFCEQCGAPLRPEARPLWAPNPLAARILSERAGIEGERKQVTVMFTDVVGSMDLTRSLDTERWGMVLDRFLAIASNAVHELEGTVNQFTGDGLMAVFGAPLAHEDHARRACLAALQLQRDVAELAEELARTDAVEFAIRCGLNSGEVIVGSIGDDLHMDFVPLGNTTALGKRMESLAPVGSTAISAETAALVEGEFVLRELGEFEVKGAGAPHRVLELVGPGVAHTRLEAVAATRGLSRFVGRDFERTELQRALEQALAGAGRAVGIVGDPGVGKSRLVHEFVEACVARGLPVNSAGCVAHGRFVPFLPVLAMYRDYFAIAERDTPEVARQRIEDVMLSLDPAFETDLPLLFDFLGVADPDRPLPVGDPEVRQCELLSLLVRTVKARSRHEAAVLVVEDVHWIDEASAVFLERLVEAVVDTRLLVVTTCRPEHKATWTREMPHAELSLAPLDSEAADALLADLLGTDRSLDGLADAIEEHAGGNPFFIEEMIQALAETGRLTGTRGRYRLAAELEELVLPPTVQAVLAARIDRLPAREKSLVQTMSVIGKEIPAPLLDEVSDLAPEHLAEAITALASAELVIPHATNAAGDYAFKHPLTQEVAYGSQLSQRRARAHAIVARAIERTYPDGLDERAAVVAQHCEAAGDKQRAAVWHARAAAWAQGTSPADGMRHWRRVRDLTTELDPSSDADELANNARIGILGMAWRLGISPEETAAIHAEGEQRSGEQLYLDANYAATLTFGGREREGLELARALFREAMASGDPGLALSFTPLPTAANSIAGSTRDALDVIGRALDLAGDDLKAGSGWPLVSPYAYVLADRGYFAGHEGDLTQAQEDRDRAIAIARDHQDPETESYIRARHSLLQSSAGEIESALANAETALALVESTGNMAAALASAALAFAQASAGDFATALGRAEATLTKVREAKTFLHVETVLLVAIAKARRGLGAIDAAVAAAEEAVEIMEARGLTLFALPAPLALAQLLMETEGIAAADRTEAVLTRAMEVARQSGARIFEPQIESELAALDRLRREAAASRGDANRH